MDKWTDEVKDSRGKRIFDRFVAVTLVMSPSSIIIDYELDYVVLTKLAGQAFQGLTQVIAHKVSYSIFIRRSKREV